MKKVKYDNTSQGKIKRHRRVSVTFRYVND